MLARLLPCLAVDHFLFGSGVIVSGIVGYLAVFFKVKRAAWWVEWTRSVS